jgi:hypothetical protein
MDQAYCKEEWARAKAAGLSPEMLFEAHERIFARRMWPLSWAEWMAEYNGVVLEPPVTFDMADPVSEDRSNTLNMTKWVWHQAWMRNTNALMAAALPTGKKFASQFGVDVRLVAGNTVTNGWRHFRGGSCTKAKVLFGGSRQFDSMTIYCTTIRRQHPTSPMAHKVYIDPLVLVRIDGVLWIAGQDESSFHAGATLEGGFKDWEATFEELRALQGKSDMPAQFFVP